MNGRILYLKTSAARVAAFFRSVILQRVSPAPDYPDYGDIEEKVSLFMEREEYLVRIHEFEQPRTPERKKKLHQRLTEIETRLAKVDLFRL